MSIMLSFGRTVGAGWTDVLASDSTVVEKLDALSSVDINALDQFPDGFRSSSPGCGSHRPTQSPPHGRSPVEFAR